MKQVLLIVLAVLLIIVLLGSLFLEVREEPNIPWRGDYHHKKKNAYDLYVFTELLKKRYGEENYAYHNGMDLSYLQEETSGLLVCLERRFSLDTFTSNHLEDFLARGGEALFISEYVSLVGGSMVQQVSQRVTTSDSIISVHWPEGQVDSFTVKNQADTLISARINSFEELDFNDSLYTDLAFHQDTLPIYRSFAEYEGTIAFHSMPSLFTNIATSNDDYLRHFNRTLQIFESDKVLFHDNLAAGMRRGRQGRSRNSSLKYIMEEPALRWAYYLLLISLLLHILFSSKRRQKQIELIPPVKNTSMEYVRTTSDLFMAQDQNRKLVPHMGNNFYRYVASKYFISKDDANFHNLLHKKSGIETKILNRITKGIDTAKNYEFTDDQLINLYKDIEFFHQNCK